MLICGFFRIIVLKTRKPFIGLESSDISIKQCKTRDKTSNKYYFKICSSVFRVIDDDNNILLDLCYVFMIFRILELILLHDLWILDI